jgi:hypothetical protein
MRPRQPIRRVSKKRLAANGGKTPFLKRSAIRKKPRKKSERERIYGPKGYVEWIHEQKCIACGVVGYSECAHIKTGGTGRKDDWTRTVPFCGFRRASFSPLPKSPYDSINFIGCHQQYDEFQWAFKLEHPDFNAAEAARTTNEAWMAFSGIPERGVKE